MSKEAELNYTKAGTGHCQLHPYYFALLHSSDAHLEINLLKPFDVFHCSVKVNELGIGQTGVGL